MTMPPLFPSQPESPPRPKERLLWPWILFGATILALCGCAAVISAAVDLAIRSSAENAAAATPSAESPTPTPAVLIPPLPTTPQPKTITYEVISNAGLNTVAYFDEQSDLAKEPGVRAPWVKTVVNSSAVTVSGLSAQTNGTSVTCRITVDGVVADERTATGKYAAVNCTGQ
ncbi:MmpS family transport accessory protein [Nocardia sp. N2S4-5]|uniref:MmpS family transport accessory protein n=1 Tax=Nocardia sp. N2S4-5 TaxID=3351565 RepID=UPI0037D45DF4